MRPTAAMTSVMTNRDGRIGLIREICSLRF
jgi:hypothetical protein